MARVTDGETMSKATKTGKQEPALHVGDRHDLIRVHGARREQPQGHQRRDPQTPAHGVHRRLGFGQELPGVRHHRRRVPAADQRDLQRLRAGLHADAGAARSRRPRRADDRDRRRPAADGRRLPAPPSAPPPTPTPCCASCSAGSGSRTSARPNAFSFNVASVRASGAITIERGAGKTVRTDLHPHRRHVPAVRGLGHGLRYRPDPAFRRVQVARRGRHHHPGLHRGRLWTVRPYIESGFLDPDKPIRKYTKKERARFPLPTSRSG